MNLRPVTRPAPSRRPLSAKVLAVGSGKGGVGKTWLSSTLAAALGRAGRRALLVDCDLGLANVDVQLGVRPMADLASVLKGWVEMEAAITPVMGGPGRAGGFDLVSGVSGEGTLNNLSSDDLLSLASGVRRVAPHYDWVIMDLAAGIDTQVMRLARSADRVMIVTTEEPTALTDAYAFAKIFRLGNHETPAPWITVNLAENRLKGRHIYDQFAGACERFLGFRPPLAGVICRDPRVVDAIRAQTPLSIRHPQATAFDDVMRIAETISAPSQA
jgi:flagellar biosynthesis protein FlhG